MGVMGPSMLKAKNYNDLTAVVFTRRNPPISCVIDGIQIASGCTLGKGTIRVSESADYVAGEFHGGNRICTIRVKPKLLNELLDGLKKATDKGILEIAEAMLTRPDEELFQIALGA
jgi:formylmethanofuran dehydrogenase subunit E